MKKKSGLFGLTLMLIFSAIFPVHHAFGKDDGKNIVTTQVVNVREGAGLSFPIVKKLSKGNRIPFCMKMATGLKSDWHRQNGLGCQLVSGETNRV
ncbi:SH3 domain-containing protein [[Brevibacterium] frigoritolerans]|uniref:SH3 domain-containing protein n=1 Tax=Peribacillus frigoritolerans TaxID=450367 RepID=A0A941FQH1_9BACI|nr:SH3 domain-containing protein [Peribacillus frigoritolerans]